MREKRLAVFLGVEAVVCVVLYVGVAAAPSWLSAAAAFPFEQIGAGLRALSLSGAVGNAVAVVLYAVLSLLPVAGMIVLGRRGQLRGEDTLLAVLSLLLFYVLYGMVNPATLPGWQGLNDPALAKMALGGAVYALLVSWLVLRLLRKIAGGEGTQIRRWLSTACRILAAVFVFAACGPELGTMLDRIAAVQVGNTGAAEALGLSIGFEVLGYLADALPYLLDVVVLFAALDLLHQLAEDRFAEPAVAAAHRLSRTCVRCLAATVVVSLVYVLLQVICLGGLASLRVTVTFPVLSVGFTLVALLLAQLVGESKQLKDDNDLFI